MPLPPELASTVDWLADGVGLIRPAEGHAGANSLVIDEGGDVVLVDAGLAPKQRRKLSPHVDVCLLTHCHPAHAHGAGDFNEVWAPKAEAGAMSGINDFLDAYDVARRDRDLVASGLRAAGYAASPVHKRFQPDGIIRLDSYEWHLVPAPGHSPGMVALLEPERHIMFAADADGDAPPWYGYPNADPTDLERTAMMLREIPVAILATSHAAPRRRGIKPLFRQMAETIRERDRLVLAALEAPRSLDELTDMGVLGDKPDTPLARYHARIMVEKHLARLMEKDYAAARQDGRFQKA